MEHLLLCFQLLLHQSCFIYAVLDYGVAETIEGTYHHVIPKGSSYIKCQYLEKKSERKNKIVYKLLPNEVLVLPAQVVSISSIERRFINDNWGISVAFRHDLIDFLELFLIIQHVNCSSILR